MNNDQIQEEFIARIFGQAGWDEGCVAEEGAEVIEISRPWLLCIDDDSEFSFGLKLRLEQRGFDVLRAYSGMEGYRYALISDASAVILDYEMPNGCGDYVMRRLKETPATEHLPVIIITGREDRALQRKMYNLGANHYLTKPLDWQRFNKVLNQYFEPTHKSESISGSTQ